MFRARGLIAFASVVSAALVAPLLLPTAASAAVSDLTVTPQLVVGGFVSPIAVTDDGTGRWFVGEQRGTVRMVVGGVVQPGNFMDVQSVVKDGGEQGLLSIAFSPNFQTDHRLYYTYTDNNDDVVLATVTALTASSTSVNSATVHNLITVSHPQTNHNGGSIFFGTNGLMFVSMGDGGGGGDPNNVAGNLSNPLGKLLRIDVSGTCPNTSPWYCVPAGNPYNDGDGVAETTDLIYASGLRNPWKTSIDRSTGQIWIGDVGQGAFEEIDVFPQTTAGLDFGWSCKEGNQFTGYTPDRCGSRTLTAPVAVLSHDAGPLQSFAFIGGYVYRGSDYPDMQGVYLSGDYVTGGLFAYGNGTLARVGSLTHLSSFGETASGELLAVSLDGGLYRIAGTAPGAGTGDSSVGPGAGSSTVGSSDGNSSSAAGSGSSSGAPSTATSLPAQTPARHCVRVPKRLKTATQIKVTKAHCRTASGSRIKTKLTAKPRGSARLLRTSSGVFLVAQSKHFSVTITWTAPASAGRSAFVTSKTLSR